VCDFVKGLDESDYEIDLTEQAVYLSDRGIKKTEECFGAENLYDEESTELLISVNTCLKAVFYLKENKDYVVRDGKIRLIDALTGRIAEDRLFPGSLQSALEVKHGLKVSERGVVTGVIPIQYFARQYGDIAGMTGTAVSSAEEFELLYGLRVREIPPRVPCVRIDNPVEVYYDGESKQNAVVREIARVHKNNRPVLIGTSTVEESERLAEKLEAAGIFGVRVLNAKNDEMEAEIIKDAGKPGAITVATNMAGRGVDIKLGGFNEESRDEVVAAGGLFIIGTALYENARMNEQINGRCGRQGDAGETKLFVALDDEIMLKYDLRKLVGSRRYPEPTEDIIKDRAVIREIERIQRISQGDLLEERKRLLKFTIIGEKHRDIIFRKRLEYLSGEAEVDIWQKHAGEEYAAAEEKFGKEELDAVQKQVVLSALNEVWCDYLEYTSELRTGIHLRAVAGKSPAEEYNIDSEVYFGGIEERLTEKVVSVLRELLRSGSLSDYRVFKPGNTRTYLMEESGDDLVKKPFLLNVFNEDEDEHEGEYEDEDEDEGEYEDENESGGEPAEKKPRKKFFSPFVICVAVGAAIGAVIGLFADFSGGGASPDGGTSLPAVLADVLVFAAAFYAGIFIHIIIHETGHLIAGKMSGYKFSSFRVLNAIFMKKDGKIIRKKFNLPGYAGQCLMIPPAPSDGKYPFVLYNMGGGLMNLIASGLFLALYAALSELPFSAQVLLPIVAAGVLLGLINIIPFKGNDGYNISLLLKNESARRAFRSMMLTLDFIAKGGRSKDMPEEWYEWPEDFNNPIAVVSAATRCGVLMDRHDFEGARELYAKLLNEADEIAELQKNVIRCELLFLEIIGQCREEEIKRLYTDELKKYMKSGAFQISKQRTLYAYAKLAEADGAKAAKELEKFNKGCLSYPYEGDLESERELIKIIDGKGDLT
jgi:preprotein translocase subunit SecA